MRNTYLVLGSALLVFILGECTAKAYIHHNAIHDFLQPGHWEALNDLCQCENGRCGCCLEMQNFKACSKMEIVEGKNDEGNTVYMVKLTITINGQEMLSQLFPASDIPPLCYESEGMAICTKISLRREMSNFKACASLQLKVNDKLIHEQEMYCIDIPTTVLVAPDSNTLFISAMLKRRRFAKLENYKDTQLGRHDEELLSLEMKQQQSETSDWYQIDPPDIIDPIHDYTLGRIDRNDDNNEWADWSNEKIQADIVPEYNKPKGSSSFGLYLNLGGTGVHDLLVLKGNYDKDFVRNSLLISLHKATNGGEDNSRQEQADEWANHSTIKPVKRNNYLKANLHKNPQLHAIFPDNPFIPFIPW